jgi:hypothetical protein
MRFLPLMLLLACDGWDRGSFGGQDLNLWNAQRIVSAEDGLYVPLRRPGGVVRVDPSGTTTVDVGDVYVDRLEPAPGGESLIARGRILDPEVDPELEPARFEGVSLLIRDAAVVATLDMPPWYREFVYAPDGSVAVATLDADDVTSGSGVVSLDSLLVADLTTGDTREVSVGFAADEVLFTTDGAGTTDGVVVLSQSEVAVLDLSSDVPVPDVVFPLTLDVDETVEPVGVALTPSEEHALISVENSADLYALDLVNPSVNIIGLAGQPSALAVDEARDRTLIVYGDRPAVEFLDHTFFSVDRLDLEVPMREVVMTEDFAVLWNPDSRDLYRVDLVDDRVEEYRLNFQPFSVALSPGADFAVALSRAEGPRMEIVSLTQDAEGNVDTDPQAFALDGPGVGVAFVEGETSTTVLLLQEGVDTLYELTWPDRSLEAIELPAPPTRIGTLPEGGFWITHSDAFGLVSFYEPGADLQTVANFAVQGLHDPRVDFWEF